MKLLAPTVVGWCAWAIVAIISMLTFSGIVSMGAMIARRTALPSDIQGALILLVAVIAVGCVICMIAGVLLFADRTFNRRPPWRRPSVR